MKFGNFVVPSFKNREVHCFPPIPCVGWRLLFSWAWAGLASKRLRFDAKMELE